MPIIFRGGNKNHLCCHTTVLLFHDLKMMSIYVGIEMLEKYLFIQVRVNKWLYDLTMSRTKTTRVSHMSNNTLTLTIWPAILYPQLVVHVKCTQMNAMTA